MGLALEVGMLADLLVNDSEGAEWFQGNMSKINDELAKAGLAAHREPTECEVWSGEMYGYSGLHYLRRLAAHLDATGQLPSPGNTDSSDDPILQAYIRAYAGIKPNLLSRWLRKPPTFARGFDHLIIHSDAEGYYIPLDFDPVLTVSDQLAQWLGSAPRLLQELERIATTLQIPTDLTSQSEALWDAVHEDSQDTQPTTLWRRYAIESFTCINLREGCRHSIQTGAALAFG